ncbi:hypothetical protein QYF61_006135 [Mycteria americana]|uniref:Uncharacterized protein n=1 Tax=Mycteria americana TaxID=33587 RepID=A0AAN7PNW8_MYCAM|nr:hypothetical protein QYF61_006135 [Mycteria americana]
MKAHKKLGGGTANLAKGLFHTIWRQAQYRNWGSWLGGSDLCSGTGWASVDSSRLSVSHNKNKLLFSLFHMPFLIAFPPVSLSSSLGRGNKLKLVLSNNLPDQPSKLAKQNRKWARNQDDTLKIFSKVYSSSALGLGTLKFSYSEGRKNFNFTGTSPLALDIFRNLLDNNIRLPVLCRVHKKLGGGTAKTVDPNWPKGYSIPYDVRLSIETGGELAGGQQSLLGDWLGISRQVAKQPQFPQPLLIRLLLQTLPQLRCPSLHTLQPLNVSLVVRGPKPNTGFEVRPHQCRVQGDDHIKRSRICGRQLYENYKKYECSADNTKENSTHWLGSADNRGPLEDNSWGRQTCVLRLHGCSHQLCGQVNKCLRKGPTTQKQKCCGLTPASSEAPPRRSLTPCRWDGGENRKSKSPCPSCTEDPREDPVPQVGSQHSRVEGQNHLPQPTGHASLDAAQDMAGFLGCERTLPAHVQLFIHQYPQVLLHRAALNPFIPQPVLILGVAPTQVQDLELGLLEPHEVHMGPLLELVQVPLDGIPSLRRVNCTSQLGVICKFAEGALDPTAWVIDEDIKQYWS